MLSIKSLLISLLCLLLSIIFVESTVDQSLWPIEIEDTVGINSNNLYILSNTADISSVLLAQYYAETRNIPSAHIINVSLPINTILIDWNDAENISSAINQYGQQAKGFAIAWSMPYTVGPPSSDPNFARSGYQSITSWVSMGKSPIYPIANNTCYYTGYGNGYSDYALGSPYDYEPDYPQKFIVKPSMLLASSTMSYTTLVSDPQALIGIKNTIQIGLSSDMTQPRGSAYYIVSSDVTRSCRRTLAVQAIQDTIYLSSYQNFTNNLIAKDIFIYQQALAYMDPTGGNLVNGTFYPRQTNYRYNPIIGFSPYNEYLPGAMADTLSSYNGRLFDNSGQMSCMEFINAGATASYGSIREPCAYTEKFPNPISESLSVQRGYSLIESYWKSVEWPMEGVFVGEPLARPYLRIKAYSNGSDLMIQNLFGFSGYYQINYNGASYGPYYLHRNSTAINIGPVTRVTMQKIWAVFLGLNISSELSSGPIYLSSSSYLTTEKVTSGQITTSHSNTGDTTYAANVNPASIIFPSFFIILINVFVLEIIINY